MISISLCMIVKNEEKILERCLKGYAPVVDEIIIVDTGSDDNTKAVAAKFTDKIYDFAWQQDFSMARNFAFSKAGMEYIFSADADEILDEKNQKKFLDLKSVLLPEIEIVQMYYTNQLEYGTTYNYDREYRPKLFKRVRNFVWQDRVHESIRLDPIIYDSDIEIIHKPHGRHGKRDFMIFEEMTEKGERLSKHLHNMYARELWICGDDSDFKNAVPYFERSLGEEGRSNDELTEAYCVLSHAYRIGGDYNNFLRCCLRFIGESPVAEICLELGEYYFSRYKMSGKISDLEEAVPWFYQAAMGGGAVLNIDAGNELPLRRLSECELIRGNDGLAREYEKEIIKRKEERK